MKTQNPLSIKWLPFRYQWYGSKRSELCALVQPPKASVIKETQSVKYLTKEATG